MSALRCGVVEYLNALPLWVTLRADQRFQIIPGIPSRLAQMLHAGDIDVGLLPVIEYFRGKDLKIVRGVGVCSLSAVDSVRLYHKVPVDEIRSVRLDMSSRTSATLVQILLSKFHRVFPEYVPGPVDPMHIEGLPEDAALVIGDPALVAMKHCKVPSIDLGREWNKFTGLPFVYAAWLRGKPKPNYASLLDDPSLESISSHSLSDHELTKSLNDAATKGKTLIKDLAKMVGKAKNLPVIDLEIYLRSRISYTMGEAEVEGLRAFSALAAELGLCERKRIVFAEG